MPKKVSDDIRAITEELIRLHPWMGGGKLIGLLKKDTRLVDREDEIPSASTIDRWILKLRPQDTSGEWGIEHAKDGDDARIVLEVYRALRDATDGVEPKKGHFTHLEAEWIIRVKRAAPTLDDFRVWIVADHYVRAKLQGQKTEGLLSFLGYRPWENKENKKRYQWALEHNQIPKHKSDRGIRAMMEAR